MLAPSLPDVVPSRHDPALVRVINALHERNVLAAVAAGGSVGDDHVDRALLLGDMQGCIHRAIEECSAVGRLHEDARRTSEAATPRWGLAYPASEARHVRPTTRNPAATVA